MSIPLRSPTTAASAEPAEAALEMLVACHGQVRRFATLCERLGHYVVDHGADAQAADAARAILRYFDLAAPLHHADEEDDFYPALRALGDPTLNARLDEIEGEHGELDAMWRVLRPWLEAISTGRILAVPAVLPAFAQAYPAHAAREEAELYGAADRLAPDLLATIGHRMRQRRGALA